MAPALRGQPDGAAGSAPIVPGQRPGVAGPAGDRDWERLRADTARLRQRLAEVAAAVAWTEECIADTYDRLALTRPQHADRLHAQAAHARRYAVAEREQAEVFGMPPESAPQRASWPAAPGPG
jgi:hypothetical protein